MFLVSRKGRLTKKPKLNAVKSGVEISPGSKQLQCQGDVVGADHHAEGGRSIYAYNSHRELICLYSHSHCTETQHVIHICINGL